ncbi:MAG: hypothetical protein ACREL6_10805, partial [Gemmatimonadales bacterium]
SATLMHHVTSSPAVIALYRALHPTIGFWLADRMGHKLGNTAREQAILDLAAERQRIWAEERLRQEPDLDMVIMGHTHRPALTEPVPGRHYLNPGAWLDGYAYAIVTGEGAELCRFTVPPLRPRSISLR